jgi:asparagine synthase (glutamine-hydrolysing)
MPLISATKDVVLIFQGEHYSKNPGCEASRNAARRDEPSAGHLLDLYVESPHRFFAELDGWFSGLIADRRTDTVILFNDRYGMARIYIHETADEFAFASEAKCLLAVRPELRSLSPAGLADYFRYNCVTRGRTLFRDVSLLPHASRWTFRGGKALERGQYFDFKEWESLPQLRPQEFYRHFVETVSTVFPAYAQPSKQVGLSLTAGLDTRAIISSLKHHGTRLPCYTFGGAWGELFDIRTARKLSAAYGGEFETIKIGDAFLDNFPALAARSVYVSDGTHDAFGAHDLYFNRLARCIAPARLTGKFGSEVVRTRKLMPFTEYPQGMLSPGLSEAVRSLPPFQELSKVRHPLTRMLIEEIPWHEYGRVAVEQSQVALRTPYMDNALVKLMFQAPHEVRAAGDLQEYYVRDVTPELAVFPTNLGRFVANNRLFTRMLYLQLRILFKVEYVYLYATPHWLTRLDRNLAALHLERILTGRQKWEGYRLWLTTHFADFVRETLLAPQAHCRQYFERNVVTRMVSQHLAGTHNHLNEINKMLSLELIHSSLLSSSSMQNHTAWPAAAVE